MNVRKPLYALGLLCLTALLTLGLASPAGAIEVCEAPPPGEGNTCFVSSTETVTVEQPIPGATTDTETFTTRVVAQGPDGAIFDQTIGAASDSPATSDALAQAKASVAAADLAVANISTSAPNRALIGSTQTEVVTPDREEITVANELVFGPDTIQVGPERSETLIVPDGATLINTVTTTTKYVNVATNTTNTYLTTATITITAVAPASPSTTTTTVSTTAPPSDVSSGSTSTPSGELARTGTATGPWTAAGIALVIAGAACLHLSRRSVQDRA